jgi:hypothetical protein
VRDRNRLRKFFDNLKKSGIEQNPRGARREGLSGGDSLAVALREGGILKSILTGTPLDKTLPEDDPAKDRKTDKVKPVTRR